MQCFAVALYFLFQSESAQRAKKSAFIIFYVPIFNIFYYSIFNDLSVALLPHSKKCSLCNINHTYRVDLSI